jgi:RNA polymerase sigma-70 factor (ECF subfamily)
MEGAMAGEFEELYTSTFGRLVGQLFLVTGDLHEAEEVVQEAFTRAAGRWHRLRDYDVPELWVRRVAINLATDGRRRVRRRLAVLAQLDADEVIPPISVDGLAVASALATLSRRQRQVVVLHYLLDLPVGEVARQLSVPVGTVKSRLARARSALAAQLDGEIERPRSGHG